MNFFDLLKIEFKKVKRSKNRSFDIYCTFVGSNIGDCQFKQVLFSGIYKCVVCNVYSKRISLCLLSVTVFHDCCMRDDCRA